MGKETPPIWLGKIYTRVNVHNQITNKPSLKQNDLVAYQHFYFHFHWLMFCVYKSTERTGQRLASLLSSWWECLHQYFLFNLIIQLIVVINYMSFYCLTQDKKEQSIYKLKIGQFAILV